MTGLNNDHSGETSTQSRAGTVGRDITTARQAYDDRVVVTPARPGADPVERLRSELAGMRVRGVPLYRVPQITRGRLVAAIDLLDGVEAYGQIGATPATPAGVLDLARDLFCAQAAEVDCAGERL